MKTKTTYGECPNCGQICQPDIMTGIPTEDSYIQEYAVCCDCKIVWAYEYEYPTPYETWESNWEPQHIEHFENSGDWYECKE